MQANVQPSAALPSSADVPACPCAACRHYATWVDPVPKPSYLFCLVAGQLASLEVNGLCVSCCTRAELTSFSFSCASAAASAGRLCAAKGTSTASFFTHAHASAVAQTACCTTSAPPQSQHTTRSGRTIQLRVWAAREEVDARRADWALACLQAAMR